MNTPRTRHASRREFVLATLGASALAATGPLFAQSWPERPITFICPWPAGGTADQSMRALCTVAGKLLGQPIAVENRAGASGMIGAKALASARADGYTIGQIPISVTRFSQLGSLQADPRKDYTYIARTSGQTFGIAVPAHSPFKTLKDFVAAAKARPGQVTYAHAGVGGATHVGMEQFAQAAGIKFNAIAYKGGSAALQDVLGETTAFVGDDEGGGGGAFGDEAILDHPGFLRAGFLGGHLGHRLGEQADALDVAPRPAQVGHGGDRDAGPGGGHVEEGLVLDEHEQSGLQPGRRDEVAGDIGAAGDLEIDQALAKAIMGDQRLLRRLDLVQGQRQGDADFGAGTFQPGEMAGAVDQPAIDHGRNLINAVGEQEAAIERGDADVFERQKLAVEIGDGHGGGRSLVW